MSIFRAFAPLSQAENAGNQHQGVEKVNAGVSEGFLIENRKSIRKSYRETPLLHSALIRYAGVRVLALGLGGLLVRQRRYKFG